MTLLYRRHSPRSSNDEVCIRKCSSLSGIRTHATVTIVLMITSDYSSHKEVKKLENIDFAWLYLEEYEKS